MRNLECRVMRGPELLRPDNLAQQPQMPLAVDTVSPEPHRIRPPGAALIHGVLPVVSRRGDRMNGGPYATSRHLHEISKVRLRIPARPYEINETSFARLELGL